MKGRLTKLSRKKLRDNSKWEMHNGQERTKLESIYSRMSTRIEKKTYCSNKKCNLSHNGKNSTIKPNLKLLLLNKMPSLMQEKLKKLLLERLINLIYWSRWTRRIESRELSFKKKCTKKELLSLLSWSIREKSTSISNKIKLCSVNGRIP